MLVHGVRSGGGFASQVADARRPIRTGMGRQQICVLYKRWAGLDQRRIGSERKGVGGAGVGCGQRTRRCKWGMGIDVLECEIAQLFGIITASTCQCPVGPIGVGVRWRLRRKQHPLDQMWSEWTGKRGKRGWCLGRVQGGKGKGVWRQFVCVGRRVTQMQDEPEDGMCGEYMWTHVKVLDK